MSGETSDFRGNDRFRLVRQLGAGGMGVVFEAFDEQRHHRVALKTLSKLDPMYLYLLKQEFRALTGIVHPNLVLLHELFSDSDHWFFTMEYIQGREFLHWVRRPGGPVDLAVTVTMLPAEIPTSSDSPQSRIGGTADPQRIRHAFAGLLEGLEHMHSIGKLHRDVKPSNVMITEAGEVKILDFGLVIESKRTALEQGQIAGTYKYMAPEVLLGLPPTDRADLFAVGVMLYQALTGMFPEASASGDDLSAAPPELARLCMSLLSDDPFKRPSATEALRIMSPGRSSVAPPADLFEERLIGRRRETEALREALLACEAGATSAVFLSGRAGMGKSTVIQHFLQELEERRDVLLLRGRCYLQESVPYKAVDPLVDALADLLCRQDPSFVKSLLPGDTAALSRIFPVLLRVPSIARFHGSHADQVDQFELRRRAFGALRELLTKLAKRRHVVLVCEDLHWSDKDSIALIADLLRPPDAPRVLLVGSHRSEEPERARELIAALREFQAQGVRVDEVELHPLDAREIRQLALLNLDVAEDDASRIAALAEQESGGNPFFVQELARAMQHSGALESAAVSLEALLEARFEQLPPQPRRLLELVALSGRPLPEKILYRAAGLLEQDPALLAVLLAGRFIRSSGDSGNQQVFTYHDRIGEVATSILAAPEKRGLHGDLAAALEDANKDAEAIAFHWEGAGQDERAAGFYQRAAAAASEALAFERAASLFRHCLELRRKHGPVDWTLYQPLAHALSNAGRGFEAAETFTSACETAPEQERLEFERRAAFEYLASGHFAQGRKAIDAVLTGVSVAAPKSVPGLVAALLWSRTRQRLRGYRIREKNPAEITAQQLRRVDACWAAASGEGMVDLVASAYFVAKSLEWALRTGEPSRAVRSLLWESANVMSRGPASERQGQALIDPAVPWVEKLGTPYEHGLLTLARGAMDFHCGRWRSATRMLLEAERIFQKECTGVEWELSTARILMLLTCGDTGDYRLLGERTPELLLTAQSRGNLYVTVTLGTHPAPMMYLAMDDPESAMRILRESIAAWRQNTVTLQEVLSLVSGPQVCFYRGEAAGATEMLGNPFKRTVGSLQASGHMSNSWLHLVRGRWVLAEAAAGRNTRSVGSMLKGHLSVLKRQKCRWTDGIVLQFRAGQEYLSGSQDRAVTLLRDSIATLDGAEMEAQAAALRYLLAQWVGGDEGDALRWSAMAWASRENIRNPHALFRMHAPGLIE